MKLVLGSLVTAGLMVGLPALADEKTSKSSAATEQPEAAQDCQCPAPSDSRRAAEGSSGGMQRGMDDSGMADMHGGMGGSGMGRMGCRHMRLIANVEVEQTENGAVLRLTAKNANQVAQVQEHAQMMERCMSASAQSQPPKKDNK